LVVKGEVIGALKYRSGNAAKLEWSGSARSPGKLTDGQQTNVPRSHGQWGGYRTSKAVAWVIDVSASEKAAWIARYKDQCSNPMPLKQAKAAAMAMAKGSAGDYRISHPITLLNGIKRECWMQRRHEALSECDRGGWHGIKPRRPQSSQSQQS
jgi:hypothetical protein